MTVTEQTKSTAYEDDPTSRDNSHGGVLRQGSVGAGIWFLLIQESVTCSLGSTKQLMERANGDCIYSGGTWKDSYLLHVNI